MITRLSAPPLLPIGRPAETKLYMMLLACLILATADAVGAETTHSILFDPSSMMRVADLKPGMKGYGLTVFRGTEPERFEAEIVGIRHRALPGDDMILCRLSHPLLQDIGVVAGMSGSPVFVNDKLIGAVAYGWTYSKEPLAGVTPIESMLRVMEVTSEKLRVPDEAAGSQELFQHYAAMRLALRPSTPSSFKNESFASLVVSKSEFTLLPEVDPSLPDTLKLEPLGAPLYASFTSPLSVSLLKSLFPRSPLYTAAMGAASGGPEVDTSPTEHAKALGAEELATLGTRLSGGYALAVPLLEGDIALAGVGTVSFRKGDKLVAFGHPMFDFGVVDYPMAPARIHSIVRSVARPFKLGESLGQFGAIRQDRLPAVGGIIGAQAPMFPVRVSVEDVEYRGRREFNFRVWADKEWGPSLAMIALTESLAAAGRSGGEAAVEFAYTIALDDGTTISKADYFVDSYGGGTAGVAVAAEVGMLMTNPFKKVVPELIEFSAQVHGRFPEAQILAASLDKRSYRPGENVTLLVELQPYRRPVEKRKIEIGLPPDLPEGTYELAVADAAARDALDYLRNPAKREIRDFASLIARVKQSFPRNRLYVVLLDSDTGSAVRGQELSRLPSSIISTLESSTEPTHYASVRGNFIVEQRLETHYEIAGQIRLSVKVQTAGRD